MIIVCILLLMLGHVFASSNDSVQLLKISAQDQRAVIKTSDGKMQIIKPGDVVGDESKVLEITAGRVVFEEKRSNDLEQVIVRLENGKQRVERIKKAGEKQAQLYAVKSPQEQKEKIRERQKDKKKKGKKEKSKQRN